MGAKRGRRFEKKKGFVRARGSHLSGMVRVVTADTNNLSDRQEGEIRTGGCCGHFVWGGSRRVR